MKFYIIIYFLLFFIIYPTTIKSQQYFFKKITNKNGLSQNTINAIYQDDLGLMWIGTNDGIDIYDGNTIMPYINSLDSKNKICNNNIACINGDNEGTVFIGSITNGLCIKNKKTNKINTLNNTNSGQKIANYSIKDIKIIEPGLVCNTFDNGLFLYYYLDNKNQTIFYNNAEEIGLPNFNNISICSDDAKNIWILNNEGIYQWRFPYDLKAVKMQALQNSSQINTFSNTNGIYISLENGIFYFDYKNNTLTKISNIKAQCLLFDSTNHLWVGTSNGLILYTLHPNGFDVLSQIQFNEGTQNNQLSNQNIISIYESKDGLIWIGTKCGGLNLYNPNQPPFQFYNADNGPVKFKSINTVQQDYKGNIYFATTKGNLFKLPYNSINNLSAEYEPIKLPSYINHIEIISEVTLQNERILLLGTNNGIISNPSKSLNIPTINSQVNDIFQDKNGFIWIACEKEGLYRVDPSRKFKNKHFYTSDNTLHTNKATCIFSDSQNRMWIGTDRGIIMIPETQILKDEPAIVTIQKTSLENGLNCNYINCMYETSNKKLLFGTNGGGINILTKMTNGTVAFSHITNENGLSNNSIKSISEAENGNLWIATNRGLNCIKSEPSDIISFGIEDGLQDWEFSSKACIKLKDGRFLFGGNNGFNIFSDFEYSKPITPPSIKLTCLTIENQKIYAHDSINGRILLHSNINYQDTINLKHNENNFAINFSIPNYLQSKKVKAKYRLKGFENNWNEISDFYYYAKYTNIPAGHYHFQIITSIDGITWSETPKTLWINIKRHPILSLSMLTIYALTLLILTFLVIKYFLDLNRKKSQASTKTFAIEKTKEINDLKNNFYINISREFRTLLSLIINPLEKLIHENKLPEENNLKITLHDIYKNASLLLKLINQILDYRKLNNGTINIIFEKGDIEKYIRKICESFISHINKNEIKFKYTSTLIESDAYFDPINLEKAIFNILNYCKKNTFQSGEIELTLLEKDNNIKLIIKYDGEGNTDLLSSLNNEIDHHSMNKNNLNTNHHVDISFAKTLIEMMHGQLDYKCDSNNNNSFSILIPKNNSYINESNLKNASSVLKPTDHTIKISSETDIHSDIDNIKTKDHSQKLLIIDDNEELRNFLKSIFDSEYETITANDGKEGLEVVNLEQPDLIISDVMMPNMDGIEMVKAIKEDIETSHIPVILLTAKSTIESQIEGYSYGVEGYVPKPFNVELLKTQVKAIINSRKNLKLLFKNNINISPSEVMPTNVDEKFLKDILAIIEENISNSNFTISELASLYGVSQTSLTNKLVAITDMKPKLFLRSIRLKRAAQLLKHNELNISEITYDVGFNDLKHFRNCFKEEFGLSPSDYRRRINKQLKIN